VRGKRRRVEEKEHERMGKVGGGKSEEKNE
jgi:hypothetical protein